MAIAQPHDKFFKETFSHREVAQAFIQELLPNDLVTLLDLDTLTLSNSSFTDEELAEHLADLVYDCKLTTDAEQALSIALLLEHKSYVPDYPHFQLLRYLLNAWNEDIKQAQLPRVVIPILVYHGDKVWQKRPLIDYFGKVPSSMHLFIPHFEYVLCNISALSDESIAQFQDKFLALTALALKYRSLEQLLNHAQAVFVKLITDLEGVDSGEQISTVLIYLYHNSDLDDEETLHIFQEVLSPKNKNVMSTYEQIELRGKRTVIINAFRKGFSIDVIAEIAEISVEKVKEIIAKYNKQASV